MRNRGALSISMPLLALSLLGLPPAEAQSASPPEALAAGNDLFAILSKDTLNQMTEQVIAQAWPSIEQDLSGKKVDAATIGALRTEFARIQMENMAEVMKGAPAIYARHFTAAELRELKAFYGSPLGQKALKEMPQIMTESISSVRPRMKDVMMLTQVSFNKILREKGYIK